MKTWKNAEVVELNINETAHGWIDSVIEISHGKHGTNNDLVDGEDSDGDGFPTQTTPDDEGKGDSSTPDTLS